MVSRSSRKNKQKKEKKKQLEGQAHRLQEDEHRMRLEGGPIEKRPNESLFFIDKGPTPLTREQKKELVRNKALSHEKILQANANISAIKKAKNQRSATLSSQKKKIEKLAQLIQEQQSKKQEQQKELYDIWAMQPPKVDPYLEIVEEKPVKKPTGKLSSFSYLPSELPTHVEVKETGFSYNPPPSEYEKVIQKAAEQEEKRQSHEAAIERSLKPSRKKIKQLRLDWIEKEEEEENEDEEKVHVNLPNVPKKTSQERKKEQRKKEFAKMLKQKKQLKKMKKDLERLPSLVEEVNQMEETLQKRQELKKQEKEARKNDPKKLGPFKFEEEPIPVLLPNQLPNHLRKLPAVENPFKSHLKSLQRRNIIEVRYKARKIAASKFRIVERRSFD